MIKRVWFPFCLAWLGLCCASTVYAAQQIQSPQSVYWVGYGAPFSLPVTYQVTSPDTNQTNGLGLRVHFNSSHLQAGSITAYQNGLQPLGEISDDTADYDNDPSTDKYWLMAWFDEASQWPNTTLPLTLFTRDFTLSTESTTVRFSASATHNNTAFQANPVALCTYPEVELYTSDATASEDGQDTGTFVISLLRALPAECGPLTVNYQVTGSATADEDYIALPQSVTIPAGQKQAELLVTALNDAELEGDETVTVTLMPSDVYELASRKAATVTIASQLAILPTVILAVDRLKVLEGSDSDLTLSAMRTGGDLSKPLTLYLSSTGSAQAGSDYTGLANSVIIPAASSTVSWSVSLPDNNEQEPNKTLQVSLQAHESYQLGANHQVDIEFIDDELRKNTALSHANTNASGTPATAIPSLNIWGLMLLSLLLAAGGAWRSRLVAQQRGDR